MSKQVTNVVVAGLGGQGVLKASDILADAAFRMGLDVKKSEIHGMSQRGGSVNSDVRFGKTPGSVCSPMVPEGQADYLVVLSADQVEVNRNRMAGNPDAVLLSCDMIDAKKLSSARSANIAMLGALSVYLEVDRESWLAAIKANLPEKAYEANVEAFDMGRDSVKK